MRRDLFIHFKKYLILPTVFIFLYGCGEREHNILPLANAGTNQVIDIGKNVTLNGSGFDIDGQIISFQWRQIAGPEVILSNDDSQKPSFIAPKVTENKTLIFELTVTDDKGASRRDQVEVIINRLLFADALTRILDDNFRHCVSAGRSEVYADEIIDINFCWYQGIQSIEGIENFTSLRSLVLVGNKLTSVDLSALTNLIYLNVANNQLTELNVSTNTKLELIHAFTNALTEIDLSNNVELQTLDLSKNQLQSVIIAGADKLNSLKLNNNQLTSVDISGNINLKTFYANYNQLTNLDTHNNINLRWLSLKDNQLNNIDISNNKLVELNLSNNQLSDIDLTGNNFLRNLYINNNHLTSIDLIDQAQNLERLYLDSNQLTNVNVSYTPHLEFLYLGNNQITNLNIDGTPMLRELWLGHNQLSNVDLTNNPNIVKLYAHDNLLSSVPLGLGNIKDSNAIIKLNENTFDEAAIKELDMLKERYINLSFTP